MSRSLKTILSEANPSKMGSAFRDLDAGTAFNLIPKFIKAAVVSNIMVLPEDAKAAVVLGAFRTVGTVTGAATPILTSATLATNQVKANALGNIEFFGTDAVTEAEVYYYTYDGIVEERSIDVVPGTGVGLLGTGIASAQLISASVTAGTLLGAKTVLARTSTAPATTNVVLNLPGTAVIFAIADAVTKALVRYVRLPTLTVAQRLAQQLTY